MGDRRVVITPKLFKRALKTERAIRPKREKPARWPPPITPPATPSKK